MKSNIVKILKVVIGLALSVIVFVFAFHRICLWQEAKKHPPIGTMVEVNGHNMHVYAEGKGSDTLVFLSGFGIASPALDFKELYSKLSDQYRIAVVERAGYGFSEPSKVSRDIDTVVEESRSSLQLAGESGPYVLFAHSMSGLEAIYWAQKYPDEVKAVIGLDAAIPSLYLSVGEEALSGAVKNFSKTSFLMQFGLIRFNPSIFENDLALTNNILTDYEKDAYRAVNYRSYMSSDVVEESRAVYENAIKVDAAGIPTNMPMYFFLGNELGEDFNKSAINYVEQLDIGKYELLDCGHYVHDYKPDTIARESKEFIESIGTSR